MLKLDLGCGMNHIGNGFMAIDKYPGAEPDFLCDLEITPWVIQDPRGPNAGLAKVEDSSVAEIWMRHILEHLGETTEGFKRIIQELYRVCCDGAVIHIHVPHPFSLAYVSDPTHVRPITPELMGLFSRKNCEHFAKVGASNSPLAVYWNVDMEVVPGTVQYALDPAYQAFANEPGWEEMAKSRTNFVQEIRFDVRILKGD